LKVTRPNVDSSHPYPPLCNSDPDKLRDKWKKDQIKSEASFKFP